jgi:hypothetical protein
MPSKRMNIGDLGRAYERIRREALAAFPMHARARTRLAILAHLHVLADEAAATLEILEKLKEPDLPENTPPWLKADKPILRRSFR